MATGLFEYGDTQRGCFSGEAQPEWGGRSLLFTMAGPKGQVPTVSVTSGEMQAP